MIQHIEGDLINTQADVLIHQCNCHGAMGAGIAKQIRQKLLSPEQFHEYVFLCNMHHEKLLGNVQWNLLPDGRRVANLFGQNHYGRDRCHTNYTAVRKGLQNIERNCIKHGLKSVALPDHMGCFLGGGNWNIVYQIITDIFSASPVTCYITRYPTELLHQGIQPR